MAWLYDLTEPNLGTILRYALIPPDRFADFVIGGYKGEYTDCIVGGTVIEDWRSDYRYTASFDVEESEIPEWHIIAVYYVATGPGGEDGPDIIGTFFPDQRDVALCYGAASGTIKAYSPLRMLDTDKRGDDLGVPASTLVWEHFRSIVEDAGGQPRCSMADVIKEGKTFSTDHIWEWGESVYDECQRCADAVGGRLDVSDVGTVSLNAITANSAKPVSFTLNPGSESVVMPGVTRPNVTAVNRMVGKYEQAEVSRFADVRLPDAHKWSRKNTGRWLTNTCDFGTLNISGTDGILVENVPGQLAQTWGWEHSETSGKHIVRLKSMLSGLYLDLKDNNPYDGAPVHVWAGNSSKAQKWVQHDNGDGTITYLTTCDENYALCPVEYNGGWGLAVKPLDWNNNRIKWRNTDYGDYKGDIINLDLGMALGAPDVIGDALKERTTSELYAAASASESYEVEALYVRGTTIGSVGYLNYDDGGTQLSKKVMVAQREIELSTAMKTRLTLEVV